MFNSYPSRKGLLLHGYTMSFQHCIGVGIIVCHIALTQLTLEVVREVDGCMATYLLAEGWVDAVGGDGILSVVVRIGVFALRHIEFLTRVGAIVTPALARGVRDATRDEEYPTLLEEVVGVVTTQAEVVLLVAALIIRRIVAQAILRARCAERGGIALLVDREVVGIAVGRGQVKTLTLCHLPIQATTKTELEVVRIGELVVVDGIDLGWCIVYCYC